MTDPTNGNSTKTYAGSFIYNDNGLEYALFEEGRLLESSGVFEYQYFLKVVAKQKSRFFGNHLGNTRVTFSANDGLIKQQDHYYPFGMNFAGINTTASSTENFFRYNGKELQKDLDLNWYDYGARFYDPQIGRWHVIDNKAEKYYGITQYAYAIDNPVLFLDPDGNEVVAMNGRAQKMILNTLPKDVRNFVSFDKNGQINKSLLNKAEAKSENYSSLKQLVNDKRLFEVNVADKFTYKDDKGNLVNQSFGPIYADGEKTEGGMSLNTGEEGFFGVTQTPGNESNKYNSPDNSIKIVVNGELSEEGQAQIFGHEAYGHGVLYSQGNDHKHQPISTKEGPKETNTELKNRIVKAILEVIKNMKNE